MNRLPAWLDNARQVLDNPRIVASWVKDKGKRICQGLKTNKARIFVIAIFVLLVIWAITLSHYNLVIGYSELSLWLTVALTNVGPELAGIVIGVVIIDCLNERRQKEETKQASLQSNQEKNVMRPY